MLHLFKACGVYMALDVLSGAVHLLDEMAYDVLTLKEEKQTDDQVIAALKEKYPEQELKEVLGEIGELVAQGALMAEHDYTGLQNQFGGVVKAMCLHPCVCTPPTTAICGANTASRLPATSMVPADFCLWKPASARWIGWCVIRAIASSWRWTSSAANR